MLPQELKSASVIFTSWCYKLHHLSVLIFKMSYLYIGVPAGAKVCHDQIHRRVHGFHQSWQREDRVGQLTVSCSRAGRTEVPFSAFTTCY